MYYRVPQTATNSSEKNYTAEVRNETFFLGFIQLFKTREWFVNKSKCRNRLHAVSDTKIHISNCARH